LWCRRRLQAIVAINLGRYDDLLPSADTHENGDD
jgi:hypothetical protein